MRILILVIFISGLVYSQKVYEIPFASEGNELELNILNDSEININDLVISISEKPDWIKFDLSEQKIFLLKPEESKDVKFNFDIAKTAEIMKTNQITFKISGSSENWTKEISLMIQPPAKFDMDQNFPNPFNPVTTIGYTIPAGKSDYALAPKVNLTVYDILGREVKTLVNENQDPGYYKYEWYAGSYASGIYISQLTISGDGVREQRLRKKMLLMK